MAGTIAASRSEPHQPWASRYVGIPFAEDGLTRAGCHCWGLVRLVLAEQCGIADLPTYGEHSAADLIAAARFFRGEPLGDPWIKVDRPQAFDVVLMTAMAGQGRPSVVAGHCGVMVDAQTVLHVWEATAAVLMGLSHHLIRHKVLGFYRHRALTACGIRAEQ